MSYTVTDCFVIFSNLCLSIPGSQIYQFLCYFQLYPVILTSSHATEKSMLFCQKSIYIKFNQSLLAKAVKVFRFAGTVPNPIYHPFRTARNLLRDVIQATDRNQTRG